MLSSFPSVGAYSITSSAVTSSVVGTSRALKRAHELDGAGGFYALQAPTIACHAQARTAGDTDWSRIAALYGELAAAVRSPIIELNRAVAVGMAEGPESARGI
jgi:predicted RNA polymerase sigma factor